MSILIRGMEMPTSCYDCDMLELSGVVRCNHAYDTKNSEWGRALDCPLIPVPPHGDLIDRGALVISTAVPLDGKPYQYVHIDHIKAAPAVIKAEEGE